MTKARPLFLAKIQNDYEIEAFAVVDDSVTVKAPDFNKFQQSSTTVPQTVQQESLRINRIP
jgi:hypothetical protein